MRTTAPRVPFWQRSLLAVVCAGALALGPTACGSSSKNSSSKSTSPEPSADVSNPSSAGTVPGGARPEATPGTLPAGTATIDKVSLPIGTVLTDGKGFTLYAFLTDQGGASPCVDACAKAWPPVTGSGIGVADGVPVSPGRFTLVTRPGGTTQVAVNGHPLYRYSGDTLVGQANGQGAGGTWFVVGLDGNPIKT
jgi:predicted lipoprotein with Yx(FWY)xxD motif